MKNVIFQYYLNYNGVGKQHRHYPTEGMPDWTQYSVEYIREYAKKHNADYYFMTDKYVESTSNYFEVTRLFKDPLFDQYDKLLYLDVDVMPHDMETNVFDLPVVDVAGWPEHRHSAIDAQINWSATDALKDRFAQHGAEVIPPKTVTGSIRMINSGMMLWSKEARIKARNEFIDHETWWNYKNAWLDDKWSGRAGHSSHCLDQPYFNAMWNRSGFDVMELGLEWNRFPTYNKDFPCVFAHYVGNSRYEIPDLFPDIRSGK